MFGDFLNQGVGQENGAMSLAILERYVMEMMRNLGKAAEAGVMLVGVSAMLLVGCGGGGSSGATGGGAAPNAFIAALTDGVGLRSLTPATSPALATILTVTLGASGSYSMARVEKTWSGSAWQVKPATLTSYYLNSSGTWVGNTVPVHVTANADGLVYPDGETEAWVAVDISGAKIKTGTTYNLVDPAISGGSAVISVGAIPVTSTTAIYPTGSTAWIGTKFTYVQDDYSVYNLSKPIKSLAGNLTTLNFADASSYNASNPLCYGGVQLVYSATQSATANTATFDVYWAATCDATAATTTKYGTVDLIYKTVRTQTVAEFSNYTGSFTGTFSQVSGSVVITYFPAPINGSVWSGDKTPAGTNQDVLMANGFMTQVGLLNKTAMDAVTTTVGLPSF
jgi:hypothetical protein